MSRYSAVSKRGPEKTHGLPLIFTAFSKLLIRSAALAMVSLALFGKANAFVMLHSEYPGRDGDLIDRVAVYDPNSPSPGNTTGTYVGVVQTGSNFVVGEFGLFDDPADNDVFTFSVPNGFQVDAIMLDFYPFGEAQGGSFFAIQAGTEIGTTDETVGDNISNLLVDSEPEKPLIIDL
ncbi:MAG: hypothetical protein AAF387_16700, partial [Pseudomonadota bacterium]